MKVFFAGPFLLGTSPKNMRGILAMLQAVGFYPSVGPAKPLLLMFLTQISARATLRVFAFVTIPIYTLYVVSLNRGTQFRTQYTICFVLGTPKKIPLIWETSIYPRRIYLSPCPFHNSLQDSQRDFGILATRVDYNSLMGFRV